MAKNEKDGRATFEVTLPSTWMNIFQRQDEQPA
jgi:hypothetical protein